MGKLLNMGLILGLLLVLAGCDREQSPEAAPSPGTGQTQDEEITEADITVEMVNSQFVPDTVEIGVGDSVQWINQDNITHRIRAMGFEQEIPPGGEYTYTFDEEGVYYYESTEYPGMVGTVVVGPVTANTAPIMPTSEPTAGTADTATGTAGETIGGTTTGATDTATTGTY